jgi:hypothetical protein
MSFTSPPVLLEDMQKEEFRNFTVLHLITKLKFPSSIYLIRADCLMIHSTAERFKRERKKQKIESFFFIQIN